MATSLSISVQGADELATRYGQLASTIMDFTTAMQQSGRYLADFFSGEVFASRGSIIGHPWPALNRRYAVEKAKHWPGRPPLVQTGLMQRSFASQYGASYAKVYNSAPYFDYHQQGTRRIPARVMMDIDQKRMTQISQFFAEDLRRKLDRVS